jgi:hypothetical protein
MLSMPAYLPPLPRELSIADRGAIDGDAVVLPKAGVLKAPFPTANIDPQAKQQALQGLLALHHGADVADVADVADAANILGALQLGEVTWPAVRLVLRGVTDGSSRKRKAPVVYKEFSESDLYNDGGDDDGLAEYDPPYGSRKRKCGRKCGRK